MSAYDLLNVRYPPIADIRRVHQLAVMRLLRKETRRIRRKYLRKVRHRGFNYYAYDRWMDWEYAKTISPLGPAAIANFVEGVTSTTLILFWLGAGLSLFWFAFFTWAWLSVAVRLGDKQYMLVTRKHLSKEYSE